MPVVRYANLHGVDVATPEDLAIVDTGVAAPISAGRLVLVIEALDQPSGGLAAPHLAVPVTRALAIHVADGHDLHPLIVQERVEVIEPLVPCADHGQRHPVAGRNCAPPTHGRGRNDRGERNPGRYPAERRVEEAAAGAIRGDRQVSAHGSHSRNRGTNKSHARVVVHEPGSAYHTSRAAPTTGIPRDSGKGRGTLLFLLQFRSSSNDNRSRA